MPIPPYERLYKDDHFTVDLIAKREKIDEDSPFGESNLRTTGHFTLQITRYGELGDGEFLEATGDMLISQTGRYSETRVQIPLTAPDLAIIEQQIRSMRERHG